MPELPEVETIKNDLRALVLGHRITQARVLDETLVAYPTKAELELALANQKIEAVDRRAKYLLLRLSSGRILVVQLMITGQLLLVPAHTPVRRSTRIVLSLDDGDQLRLNDSSRFARLRLVDPADLVSRVHLDQLGPEASSNDLTPELLARLLKGRRRQIKAVLLDQHIISGLGNIYTDEALHEARVHPSRPAGSLTSDEVESLFRAIRRILGEAVSLRGTTTRSYLDVLGRKGGYQAKLKVFRRAGEDCPDCAGKVVEARVAGRDTFFCPTCQLMESPRANAA